MIAGLSGSLFSHDALERLVIHPSRAARGTAAGTCPAHLLRAWYIGVRDVLGPASSARRVYDLAAEPLARFLGFTPTPVSSAAACVAARLHVDAAPAAVLVALPWGEPAMQAWRTAVHQALAHGVRWSIAVDGSAVRLFDAGRAYARRFAAFDLALACEDDETREAFWTVLQASAFKPRVSGPVLDELVGLCERHRTQVGQALRAGVHDALRHLVGAFRTAARTPAHPGLLDESLVVIYRILFLLFAEARGLVPSWHPIYREGYTLNALCRLVERGEVSGIWEALQAIARLAHRGCQAGTLRVPPFNGRLFSPGDAPLAERLPLDDRPVGRALLALTVRRGPTGIERVSYADLGVEQLGTVYEHLLDVDLENATRSVRFVPSSRRKDTGSFYTPRSLTEFLVRRTLAPLVTHAAPDDILRLRILDPAMGSGAFLVSACRYLAAAYEQALIRDGTVTGSDLHPDDRAGFRRAIAQHCLFGVDANPMAVHLGRLSLWLATLAADKPLSFFDHHLRAGNSLVGASIEDMLRRPGTSRRTGGADLPLFEADVLHACLQTAVERRLGIVRTPDDTIQQVHSKTRTLTALMAPDGPLARWKRAADVWCAACYGRGQARGGTARALLDRILRDDRVLPDSAAEPLLASADTLARTEGFFHWPFEFPEAFYDEAGSPLQDAGFDAVIGNPPWDMLREQRTAPEPRGLAVFARTSGVYGLQGTGGAHANLYQLFMERALRLLKRHGRLGFVLPSGFATDQRSAALRAHALARTTIDTFTTVENRDAIFPIHRGLKFLLLTLTNSGTTPALPSRSGVRSPAVLERVPDTGHDHETIPVPLSLVERVSGETLAVPEIRDLVDLDILSRVVFSVPAAADPAGWHLRFGRELNVSDDRRHFSTDGRGLPVLEGKQIQPFAADTASCRFRIARGVAARLLEEHTTFGRPRLAYREVAAATNRLTLIAAIVPAHVVTSHTVFCLKTPLDEEPQHFLCGVLNSYVANYFVRMRVGTHVTAGILARIPLPRPSCADPRYGRIAALSRRLAEHADPHARSELQAVVATLYGLTCADFAHILGTFPLIPQEERSWALRLMERGGGR